MSDYFQQHVVLNSFNALNTWTIATDIENNIKSKLIQNGKQLKELDISIYRGILTGYNDAFIIDASTREAILTDSPESAEIIRPILRGKDIQRYRAKFEDYYIIGAFPSLNIDIDRYSSIKEYLLSFDIRRLEQTGKEYVDGDDKIKARKRTTNKWFETQDTIAYWKDFNKPKVVWKRIGSILRFCYDDSGLTCLDSTCFATGSDIKFLTGYLNSSISRRELLNNSPKTGTGDVITSVQALEPHIIPNASTLQKNRIAKLVDNCIEALTLDDDADISFFEHEIDNLIFDLFKMNEEEKKFILESV